VSRPELAGFKASQPAASVRVSYPSSGATDVVVPSWNGTVPPARRAKADDPTLTPWRVRTPRPWSIDVGDRSKGGGMYFCFFLWWGWGICGVRLRLGALVGVGGWFVCIFVSFGAFCYFVAFGFFVGGVFGFFVIFFVFLGLGVSFLFFVPPQRSECG